jgi:hypothetical protein
MSKTIELQEVLHILNQEIGMYDDLRKNEKFKKNRYINHIKMIALLSLRADIEELQK